MSKESQQLPIPKYSGIGGSIKKLEEDLDSSKRASNASSTEILEPTSPSTNGVDALPKVAEDETSSDKIEKQNDCEKYIVDSSVCSQILISNSEKSEVGLETNLEEKENESNFTNTKEKISDLIAVEKEEDCVKINQEEYIKKNDENESKDSLEEFVNEKTEEIGIEISEFIAEVKKDKLEISKKDEIMEIDEFLRESQTEKIEPMEINESGSKEKIIELREAAEKEKEKVENNEEKEMMRINCSESEKKKTDENHMEICESVELNISGSKPEVFESLVEEKMETETLEFGQGKKVESRTGAVESIQLNEKCGMDITEPIEENKDDSKIVTIELVEEKMDECITVTIELAGKKRDECGTVTADLVEEIRDEYGVYSMALVEEKSDKSETIESAEEKRDDECKTFTSESAEKKRDESGTATLDLVEEKRDESGTAILDLVEEKRDESGTASLDLEEEKRDESGTAILDLVEEKRDESGIVSLGLVEEKKDESGTASLDLIEEKKDECGVLPIALAEKKRELSGTITMDLMEEKRELSGTITMDLMEEKRDECGTITTESAEEKTHECGVFPIALAEQKDASGTDTTESAEEKRDESETVTTELAQEKRNKSQTVPLKSVEEKKDESGTVTIDLVKEKKDEPGIVPTESVEEKKDECGANTTKSVEGKKYENELETEIAEDKKEDEVVLDISKISPKSVDLGTDTQDFQGDLIEEEEFKETEVLDLENEKELSKSSSGQSNVNSSAELDEENINRSESDMMDTEMVNCNEIEQIDLNEAELQKEKEEDRFGVVDGKTDSKEESDTLETDNEKLKPVDVLNEPGNSEEETITGDTNQSVKANDELCIIPDDISKIPALPQESNKKTKDVSGKSVENSKTKGRPVRNAAKVAGNKIKSLVDNYLVPEQIAEEEQFSSNKDQDSKMCTQCKEVKVCKFIVQGETPFYLCSKQCSTAYKTSVTESEGIEIDANGEFIRKCAQCRTQVSGDEKCLFWETMDFCNEDCLEKYQKNLGSSCANCKGNVPHISLGKYCVRFGYDVKQFCSSPCLDEYKKGLKVCSYCQKDISTGPEGFLAPVGDKGQFKDFCSQSCMGKYERMSSNAPRPDVIEECAVCSNSKPVCVEVDLDNKTHKLCSEPCFAAFKFVNNITAGQCDMCRKYFDKTKTKTFTLFFDENSLSFCCKACMNVYILANRKIIPCNWCKVKKYNFDMIKKVNSNGQLTMMCSLNCLMLYQMSVNAVCARNVKCDFCLTGTPAQYHLTMSDSSIKNFCSYNCVMFFQSKYPQQNFKLISVTEPITASSASKSGSKRRIPRPSVDPPLVPVISSTHSLASSNGPASPLTRGQISKEVNVVPPVTTSIAITSPVPPMPAPPPPQIYQQIITKPPPAKEMKNKSVLCKPYSHTKGVSCRPHPCMKETQTDQSLNRKFLIPIPIPIYVPAPMHMFATPFPVPVPFPLPIPVPIFIPTTRNSAKGIMKEIKKIQEKIPTDPFEAELLMMAEMVAGDKKQDPTDSESEDGNEGDDGGDGTFSPENVDTSNTFGDDMLQMALKMASELEEPAVDMESVLTSNTITTTTQPAVDPNKALYASDHDDPDQVQVMSMNRGRKRSVRGGRNSSGGTPSKRGRRTSGSVDVPLLPPPEPVPPPRIEVEKPDANMCLKYTFGVNAWRHWVLQKNAELEKAAMTNRKIKLFKPELLQLTADELNFSLCLFVKEVRKPNGTEYAPDTIYYLCLGIQQYLFENGRIDNIFTDSYYEKFTDCLDEVAKKFAALYNDSQYIVTRVEEEHLWESKQLGAHSPHVLLSTLMFFNTKHFNLVTVEEHMQLSFSHIMKHWKRNPNTPGVAKVPGSRNVLLRFYPPQSALEANSRKKKVYEQQENEENPLRCPVKLYEFYLSKCPESVKTRNDVFYLLPERSCVPDSPVWYSTMALGREPLMKMLHRVKMVKEINIALLSC